MDEECLHDLCNSVSEQKDRVRIALLSKCDDEIKILLGKEKYGWNKGYFNTCGGSVESLCYVKDAQRELREEFKIKAVLDKCDYYIPGRIIIFILWMEYFDSSKINEIIKLEMLNDELPPCFKEIEEVKWFNLTDYYVDSNKARISRGSLETMKYLLDHIKIKNE